MRPPSFDPTDSALTSLSPLAEPSADSDADAGDASAPAASAPADAHHAELATLFADDGTLAKGIDGYRPRSAQLTMAQAVINFLKHQYDYVFIDTPGVDSPGTLSAIRAADLCIIPCRPTPADLRAFKPTLAAIYRLEKKFAFVLNQTPPRSYRVRDAADGLAVLGILPDVNIVARTDHQDAIGLGLGVTELNPKGQAAAEVRKLWSWIERRSQNARTDKHVQAA